METELEERPKVPPAPPVDENWILLMVPVASLFVDRRYQRGMVKGQVRRLVENWDWDKYHPITISHRADGRYAIISGQQRTTAAIELGIENLPAIVKKKTDIKMEAKSYLGSGEVANIQASDRFKARLIANEQKAFDIWQEVEKCGFALRCMREEEPGWTSDPFSIEAVYCLESIFDTGYLTKTLTTISQSWGNQPTKDMVQSNVLRGVYLAIRHLEQYEVTPDMLAGALSKVPVKEIIDKGYDRYRSMVHSRSIDAGVAAVLIDQFNYRRKDQVPEFSKKAMMVWRARVAGLTAASNPENAEKARENAIARAQPKNKSGRFTRVTRE